MIWKVAGRVFHFINELSKFFRSLSKNLSMSDPAHNGGFEKLKCAQL